MICDAMNLGIFLLLMLADTHRRVHRLMIQIGQQKRRRRGVETQTRTTTSASAGAVLVAIGIFLYG
jgi:hypothetical protein